MTSFDSTTLAKWVVVLAVLVFFIDLWPYWLAATATGALLGYLNRP